MKLLTEILGDVKKGNVIKIHFGRGESYVGVVVNLNKKYFSLSGFSDNKKKEKYKINFTKPEFGGKSVKGYDKFLSEREAPPNYDLINSRTGNELTDRDFIGFCGPFRDSLSQELAESDERRERYSKIKEEEVDLFDKSTMSRDF